MAQVRDIKRRITSVQNTQQITRAMKMVAAAKLRRAQEGMLAMRPYADQLDSIIGKLAYDLFGDENPLWRKRQEKSVATVVIAGDKGLCGGFNTNVIRKAHAHFAGFSGVEQQIYAIGKRATSALKKTDMKIVHSYQDVFDKLSYVLANDICQQLVEKFMAREIDSAYLVYNEFVTVMSQNPVVVKLLPIDFAHIEMQRKEYERKLAESAEAEKSREFFEIEPDIDAVMARLVNRLLATRVYHATLESYAAELGARMSAMDSATNNAEEMIEQLTMDYNRARQAGITGDLLDIVGGAESLAG